MNDENKSLKKKINCELFPLIISSIKKNMRPYINFNKFEKKMITSKILTKPAILKRRVDLLPYFYKKNKFSIIHERTTRFKTYIDRRRNSDNEQNKRIILEEILNGNKSDYRKNSMASRINTKNMSLINSKTEEYNFVGKKRILEDKGILANFDSMKNQNMTLYITVKRNRIKHIRRNSNLFK